MFAIIKTGGKQYLVQAGSKIKVEKLEGEVGDTVVMPEVLLMSDTEGKELKLGKVLTNAKVQAKILTHGRAEKVTIFKHKPKKRYKLKKGHRQPYTELEITKIA